MSQFTERYKAFERASGRRDHEALLLKLAMDEFERRWSDSEDRLRMIGGKEALSNLNASLQARYKIGVTPSAIVEAMRPDEIPPGMKALISTIAAFIKKAPPDR